MVSNQIKLALSGETIAITLWSENGGCTRTRQISLESAVDLSLLLDGGAFPWALNFGTGSGVALQIENLPFTRAWISLVEDASKGHDLNACVEGEAVAEIGRLLNDLVAVANDKSKKANKTSHVRPVEYCYLDDGRD